MRNGKITISKPTRGDGLERVEISVKDDLSRNRFVTVSITLENFAHALMGLSEVECQHELRKPEIVGKKKEIEKLEFEMPQGVLHNRKSIAAAIANREMPYGWELWDNFSSQNSFFTKDSVDMARCSIIRYVDAD